MAKILSVDDSATIRLMVSDTLQNAGYEVEQACDGLDGLGKLHAGAFQLIISDVNMPKMDGLTFVRELRKLDAHRFTPVLMLTTESAVEKKQEAKSAGATGWLVKPFDPEQLLRTIRRILG